MPDLENKQKYMIKRDLAVEVANLAEIESYDPDREASFPADFRKEETRQLYEIITGESGEDLSQREMNTVMMQEIGGGIKAAYQYDLTREDLKVIHRELSQRDD